MPPWAVATLVFSALGLTTLLGAYRNWVHPDRPRSWAELNAQPRVLQPIWFFIMTWLLALSVWIEAPGTVGTFLAGIAAGYWMQEWLGIWWATPK